MASNSFKVKNNLHLTPQATTPSGLEIGDIWSDSTGKIYRFDGSASREIGSAQGGINYIENPDFESNATGYVAYADAAAATPVDATGGSPVTTIVRSTSVPLRGTASGLWSKSAANRQGEGFSDAFTIDTADQAKMIEISFDYTVSTNFVDGDMRMFIYDVTNARLIEPSQRDILANSGQATYRGYFQANSNSTSYRLVFHVATVSALAYDFKLDNVRVGPVQAGNAGTFVSDWQAYTPTFTGFGSTSGAVAQWRRVGSSVEVEVSYTCGTPTGVEARVSLPSGLTIASTVTALTLVGFGDRNATAIGWNILASAGNTYFNMDQPNNSGIIARNGDLISGAGEVIKFKASVQIAGWSTGVSASEIPSNQAVAFKAALTANQTISSTAITKLAFNTVSSATGDCFDTAGAFDTTNNRFVAPESGVYFFKTTFQFNGNMTAAEYFITYFKKNDIFWSADYHWNGSTSDTPQTTKLIRLNKGDYVEVFVDSSTDASYTIIGNDQSQGAFFEGFKINSPAQIAPTEVVVARYETNAGQSIPNNANTDVVFEDKVIDSHNGMNTSTGVYTVPISGQYLISARLLYVGTNTWSNVESQELRISTNKSGAGYTIQAFYLDYPFTGGSITKTLQASTIVDLSRGDLIKIVTAQVSGAALALDNSSVTNMFSIARIK